MKKIVLGFSIFALLAGLLSACGTAKDPGEAYQNETPVQIYQYGRASLRDKSYGEAVKRFEALDIQYPFDKVTESAQLYLIYAYYMKEDYALSVAAADRFIRLHPTSPHVDYAYYMRGLASYYQNLGFLERAFSIDLAKRDLTQIKKSYHDFSELVRRFPQSPYAPAAQQFRIYLRNVLAQHELDVARYYYQRKAYLAAANRASEVVAHFQGAPAVIDALKLMAKSYQKLGMRQNEQEAIAVLKYNYPGESIN